MAEFTHLHLHTEYSLLDGLNRTTKLMDKVKKSGMDAVAITDHGVMYGVAEFWKYSKEFGVKPIIGCEIYVSPGPRNERKEIDGFKYFHLVLLAQNLTGYHNLIKLVSIGHLEGLFYRPRVDRETLAKYSEGIICTSACLASPLSRHILSNQNEKAEEWMNFFKSIYPGRFYLELQRNGFSGSDEFKPEYEQKYDATTVKMIQEQILVNNRLKEYGQKFDLPLVATTDAHFLDQSDSEVQKILFCIKDGTQMNDPKTRNGYVDTYVTTPEEMQVRFSDDLTPLHNTVRITEQVEAFDIRYPTVQPKFWNLSANITAQQELRNQTYVGAEKKYKEVTPELKERIDYELDVIHNKGFDDYFLVVSDLMKWAASKDILMGVRGSAAGSVVAHCIDIVEVDPLKWELYFERFLNPERPTPPDIDMDIQDSRRDEVIAYVEEKYGRECLSAICAIGRLKTKAAIRDVARVMGVDLVIADKMSKMIKVVFGKVYTIDKQIAEDEEFKQLIESNPQLQKLAAYVRKIEGMARHMSTHACGYLITPEPIVEFSPLQLEAKGTGKVITQWEGPWMEELGLMKFDFLGLRTLTIISNAIKNIERSSGVKIDFYAIPQDDKKTFELFSRGETMGIFQFESPPMRKYLQDLQPETQEDLCFMVAAYRPGPMKYIPDYILRKHGKQAVEYLTPGLVPIVGNTYGYAIYQEQVIKIAVDLAGYSMGQADMLRRAMGKKKLDVMKKEEAKFKEGIKAKQLSDEIGDQLWNYLLPFADYGFNKAHAAGYAVLAYKCAYLKAHYPLEFMAALMYSDLDDSERIVTDIDEAKHMGYKVAPPDVNKSFTHFSVEGEDTIRFGLGAIKNVGDKVCEETILARQKYGEFANLDDYINKVGPKNLNKKALECLIMCGAMDSFGSRNQLLGIVPIVYDQISRLNAIADLGQTDMFGGGARDQKSTMNPTALPTVEMESSAQKVTWEKELMGVFLSSHPLLEFNWLPIKKGFTSIVNLPNLSVGSNVKIAGIVANWRKITTKKDNKAMAFLKLEDLTGTIDSVLFPQAYTNNVDKIQEAVPLVFTGKIANRDGTLSILLDDIQEIGKFRKPKSIQINICGIADKDELEQLKNCFDPAGEVEVTIMYGNRFNPSEIKRQMNLASECIKVISKYIVE